MAETFGMSLPRRVIPGRTYLFTRRTSQREFLLRPDAEVNAIFEYCLAVAAKKFKMVIHGWMVMSNHYHLLATDSAGRYPDFLAWLNRMTARALNIKWGREENLWSTAQASVVWCVTSADAFRMLVYLLANPVAADLVGRTKDWPGSSSLGLHLHGAALSVERPANYFSKRSKLPHTVELTVVPIPGLGGMTEAAYSRKILRALRHQETLARSRRERSGKKPLGREAVLATRPTARPADPAGRHAGGQPHLACGEKKRRSKEFRALASFWSAHREARERFCVGDREVLFPIGTYRMCTYGAIAALPDPLLSFAQVA
ncbi:MAG: transposase [Deltaproteobacteria bacterium]|nr:transposase [Deltaproteobacteria bacterium]